MTEWRPISGHPKYEVSEFGDVRNAMTGVTLKPQYSNGYLHVTLCGVNGHHQKSVHRIVATEFIDNPLGYNTVNHIDGVKTNNRVDNLEWCTQSDNMKHAYRTGLQRPISDQISYSLGRAAEKRKRPVRNVETGRRYDSIIECAKAENICHSAVSAHLAGKTKVCRFEYDD